MGKDLPTKNLLNCPDVFADITNVNLFDGEELLQPEELAAMPTELVYKNNYGTMRHHYLDTRMKAAEHQTDIAVFCIENQSGINNIMPVRDMGYLYSNYSEQIREIQRKDGKKKDFPATEGIERDQKLTPVISLVLYYGQEPWYGPEKLSDLLSVSEDWKERLEPLITDHPVRIVHLAGQDKKTRMKYKSDFRHIADYLACAGNREESWQYISDESREIRHPEEYLDMMAAFSNDTRFARIKETVLGKRKEGEERVTMFSIAEELESIGMKKGASEKSREIICTMLRDEQPPELISKYTKEPLEYVYQMKQEMLQYAKEETVYHAGGETVEQEK